MARYICQRCHRIVHTTDAEHICKDIQQRLRRRTAQVEAVRTILLDNYSDPYGPESRIVAEAIVEKLAQMGVADD